MAADTIDYYRHHQGEYLSLYIKDRLENSVDLKDGVIYALIIFAFILSLNIAKPTLASPQEEIFEPIEPYYTQEQFEKDISTKYNSSKVYYPSVGIAHIKKIKYINSKPIKINIVEINTNLNQNLIIKPKTASQKLNHKTTVKNMAKKENAIIAINAGYFKPQTGVPLGALVINGEILTGPIYNRVGIGIFENNGKISYAMDNVGISINAYTKNSVLKIDNINQPRISQSYTLMYNDKWGAISPPPPQNGYNMLIRNNQIIKISANPITIEENDIVISSSKELITNFAKDKEIYITSSVTGKLKNAKHIIAAGPYLVKDENIYVDVKTQKFTAIAGKNPRSAIGYTKSGNLIIVTVDGREKFSVGVTLSELSYLMKSLGCIDAMNLDGGSSSALFVGDRIVNDAINKEGALVSNAIIVKNRNENNS